MKHFPIIKMLYRTSIYKPGKSEAALLERRKRAERKTLRQSPSMLPPIPHNDCSSLQDFPGSLSNRQKTSLRKPGQLREGEKKIKFLTLTVLGVSWEKCCLSLPPVRPLGMAFMLDFLNYYPPASPVLLQRHPGPGP